MKVAVYPGSFDPITNGHLDIIERASKIADKLIVLVAHNISKNGMFTSTEKARLIKESVKNFSNVEIDCFEGLLVEYVKENNINFIVRGLRAISDFEMELQMAILNRKLYSGAETLFLMTSTEHSYLSSSMVKELFQMNGSVSQFVPECVEIAMKNKLCGGETNE